MLKKILCLCCFSVSLFCFSHNINKYVIDVVKNQDTLFVDLDLKINTSQATQNYFLLWSDIIIEKIDANNMPVKYYRNDDTLFITESKPITHLNIKYKIPLQDLSITNAVILRRECLWYPHRKGDIFTSSLSVNDSGNYVIASGSRKNNTFYTSSTNELHLFLLSQKFYQSNLISKNSIPIYSYIYNKNIIPSKKAFYEEFSKAYKFFSDYFEDSRPNESLHIVEIADENFQMCQSLKGTIIFGEMFYKVYCMDSLSSWVPHEIAHQWWGNRILFKSGSLCYRFLEESITEHLKHLYVQKEHGQEAYKNWGAIASENISKIEKPIPISEITDVNSYDPAITIYCKAPLLLDQLSQENPQFELDKSLKKTYQKYKGEQIDYKIFETEITNQNLRKALQNLIK